MARDDDAVVVDLTPEEIEALETSYSSMIEPLPKVAKEAATKPAERQAESIKRSAKEPDKPDEATTLRERLRQAEEKLAAERNARTKAETLNVHAGVKLAVADAHVVDNQAIAIDNALAKVKDEASAAKAAHKAALETGDYDAATAAMERMTATTMAMRDLSEGKAALAEKQRETRDKIKAAGEVKAPVADPTEVWISQHGAKEQAWLRAHMECVTTPRLNKKLLWAHDEAVDAKIQPGSDEYFAFLDKHMGYANDEGEANDTAEPEDENVVVDTKAKIAAPASQPKKVAAPVSRDGTIQQREDGKFQVRLTPEQKQMAHDLGMSPTAYAKQLIALKANEKTGNGPRLGSY